MIKQQSYSGEISVVKNEKPNRRKKKLQLNSNSNSNSSGSGTDLLIDHFSCNNTNNIYNTINNANHLFSLQNRIDLSSKLIENNSDLILNCVQLINFIDFYFNDTTTTQKQQTLNQNDSNRTTNRAINACFPCIVCSMQFSFDQTFHMHLERRSVIIRVYCVKCDSLKKFYNKCKLLYHVYSHKMTLFDPIYKSIQIESLSSIVEPISSNSRSNLTPSSSLQVLSKERNIDIDLIFSNVNQFTSSSPSNTNNYSDLNPFNNGFKLCDNDLVQIKMFLKTLIINNFLVYKCHICDAIFFHLKDLKHHYMTSQQLEFSSFENTLSSSSINRVNRCYFQNLKKRQMIFLNNNKKIFKNLLNGYLNNEEKNKIDIFVNNINNFSFKKLQFSNRCYALASQNLLNNDETSSLSSSSSSSSSSFLLRNNLEENFLICPECGLSFDARTQSDYFKIHLVYECLFTVKYAPYQIKCPSHECKLFFENLDDAISHWSSVHVLKQHQCDLCDKKGIKVFFNETNNLNDSYGISSSNNDNSILKQILDSNNVENGEPSSSTTNKSLSPEVISQINKHYFERHRNQPISLKLIYKCLCKTTVNLTDSQNNVLSNDTNRECLSTRWEIVQKHSFNIISKSINTINCLLCKKLIFLEEYQTHMNTVHTKEKFCICPLCGIVKNENSLHNHIIKFHHDLNLKSYGSSCFFNLLNSLDEGVNNASESFSKKIEMSLSDESIVGELKLSKLKSKTIVGQNSENIPQILFPNDLFIYQCVNCRLFFTSNSSFSHNCLVTIVDKQPPTYFSPIYLKFDINKIMLNSKKSSNETLDNDELYQCDSIEENNNENNDLIINNKRVKLDTT